MMNAFTENLGTDDTIWNALFSQHKPHHLLGKATLQKLLLSQAQKFYQELKSMWVGNKYWKKIT